MIVQLHRALQNREVDFSAGPNSEEALDLQNIWMFFIQHLDVKDTPVSEIKDKCAESYIIDDWRQKKREQHILDVVRCSEVAHGVSWVRQVGMKRKMHGLWIGHDGGRLLFLSPPQTCCLRVQVPLCGIRQTMGWPLNKVTVMVHGYYSGIISFLGKLMEEKIPHELCFG